MSGVTSEDTMGNGTKSISPVPVEVPDDIRTRCAEIFATISNQQSVMLGEIKDLRKDVKDFIREQSKQGSDIRNAWLAIRNDIQPAIERTRSELKSELKEVKLEFNGKLSNHIKECPARKRVMRRVESDSDDEIDVRNVRKSTVGHENRDDEPSQIIVVQSSTDKKDNAPAGIPWAAWIIGTSIAVATVIGLVLARQFGLF